MSQVNKGHATKSKNRRRAEILHAMYTRYVDRIEAKSLFSMIPVFIKYAHKRGIAFSKATCYKTFERWNVDRTPESLLLRWSSSGLRKYSDAEVEKIGALALAKRVSVHALSKSVVDGPKYRTVMRRSKNFANARELAQIDQKKRSLALREKKVLEGVADA